MSIIWLVLYYSSYFISPNSLALTILRQLFDILFYFNTHIVIYFFYFTLAIFPTTIFRLLLYDILRIQFYSYYSTTVQYFTSIIFLQNFFHFSYFPSFIIFLLFKFELIKNKCIPEGKCCTNSSKLLWNPPVSGII